MKFGRSLGFLAALVSALCIGALLSVAVTTKSYSESYPAVVCPPTLAGLTSQISLASKKTPFQRLQNRTTKTAPVKILRLPVSKDSLLFSSDGVTPVVWQSKSSSWAGGAVCTGPATSQWFVGGTADITTRGRLMIVNSGLSDAVVDVQSFTENGKQPLRTITVVSKNYLVIATDSLAPGDKYLTVHVAPRSGRVNAFMIDERSKGLSSLGGDLINFAPSASKSVMIPAIPHQIKDRSAALPHTLRVLTPGDVDANVTAEVLSADGVFVPVGLTSRSISAGIVTEFQITPKISSTVLAIRITSTEPVVAAIKSTVTVSGRKDFVWSTSAPALVPLTIAISGLTPLISFAGERINVSLDVTLNNGKVIRKVIKGTEIVTWRAPDAARSFTITKVGPDTFAGALVSSVNGYGYFPIAPGSLLTKIELPESNIRVLNP
jgi:Family of unknown function (DUF5719)